LGGLTDLDLFQLSGINFNTPCIGTHAASQEENKGRQTRYEQAKFGKTGVRREQQKSIFVTHSGYY
jgi:hypothetical protein